MKKYMSDKRVTLPIQKRRESYYQTVWNHIVKEAKFYGYFELKKTLIDKINYAYIPQHQIDGLLSAQEFGVAWKISDQDQRMKPFDSFFMPPQTSYLVIYFVKKKQFCAITIENFLSAKKESEENNERFFTYEKAYSIATKVFTVGIKTHERNSSKIITTFKDYDITDFQ